MLLGTTTRASLGPDECLLLFVFFLGPYLVILVVILQNKCNKSPLAQRRVVETALKDLQLTSRKHTHVILRPNYAKKRSFALGVGAGRPGSGMGSEVEWRGRPAPTHRAKNHFLA